MKRQQSPCLSSSWSFLGPIPSISVPTTSGIGIRTRLKKLKKTLNYDHLYLHASIAGSDFPLGLRFYWVAICIITMRHTKVEDWARTMFVKLHRQLKQERPDFLKSIEDIFVKGTDGEEEL